MKIDKDLVQKTVDDVVANLAKENEEEDENLIYTDEDTSKTEENSELEEDLNTPADENEELNDDEGVEEKVDEEVEEEIEENPNFNFLGLDVNVEKTEDGKYNVKIVKDEKEKVEVLDSADLTLILNVIEEFFNELVLEEPDESEDAEEEAEEDEDQTIADILEDFNESKEDDEENNDEEDLEDNNLFSSMASLKTKYSDDIEKIFEHGLLAKEIVLDMIRDKLTAKTVKELNDKFKENNELLASKKTDLKNASIKYLVAKKYENNLKKSMALLSNAIDDLKVKTEKNEISAVLAKKAITRYKSIISELIEAKDSEAIVASTNKINKVNNAIVANVNKNKIKSETNDKKEIKFNKTKNVYNRTGRTDNKSLVSNKRYDSIDEMSAEILKIAGIEE